MNSAQAAVAQNGAFASPGEWTSRVTGCDERYLPLVKSYSAAMHLGHMASYKEALRYSYGRRVLDIGCGVGYGAFFLASYGAMQVIALDRSSEALSYAAEVYHHPRLQYIQADALHLPLKGFVFDFVFSSQVIEHVPSAEHFMREAKRALAPDGFCLITTANRDLFSPGGSGANPHHINEMNWESYKGVAQEAFPNVRFRGIPQHCLTWPEGGVTPVLKPNTEVRLQDFRAQDYNWEQCENMLCLGHARPEGDFAVTLPRGLEAIADELAPFFWDASISQWTVLGLYPHDGSPTSISLVVGHSLVQVFESPYPDLYRLQVDLVGGTESPVKVHLGRWPDNGHRSLVEKVVQPYGGTIDLLFHPQGDSEGQRYALTIQRSFTLKDPFRHSMPLQLRGVVVKGPQRACLIDGKSSGARLAIRTFHAYLPAPCI